MLRQRLIGFALIIIPLLVMRYSHVMGEIPDMGFALAICWPYGIACLVSKKYLLMV